MICSTLLIFVLRDTPEEKRRFQTEEARDYTDRKKDVEEVKEVVNDEKFVSSTNKELKEIEVE